VRLDILAALSGVLISLQTRANGELSHLINNGLEAALVSFGSGLIIILIITPFNPHIKEGISNLRASVARKEIARWKLLAGALGGSFVAIQTQVVPLIGVAIYSVASIAGQTAMSLIVDRIGLTGGGKKLISPRRLSAAFITVLAVLVSVLDRINANNLSKIAVIGGCVSGALVGFRSALNGEINEHSHQSFTTSLLNFISGTTFLIILMVSGLIFGKIHLSPLPAGPWWIYTGGVIGVVYIAFISTIVQHLGVLTFTLFSVGGQLFSSLIIDLVSPTDGVRVSAYLVTGIVMTYLGVIAGGVSSSRVKKPQKLK
jgi:transporter family-2 protein